MTRGELEALGTGLRGLPRNSTIEGRGEAIDEALSSPSFRDSALPGRRDWYGPNPLEQADHGSLGQRVGWRLGLPLLSAAEARVVVGAMRDRGLDAWAASPEICWSTSTGLHDALVLKRATHVADDEPALRAVREHLAGWLASQA